MRTNAADPIDSTEHNPSASPEAKHFSSLGKTRATGLILAGAVIAFFVIANLPFQYVEAETYWRGGHNLGGATSISRYGLYPVAAGWPLNYSVRYQLAGLDQQRYWSTLALLVNLALAIASAIVVFHYLQLRQRRIQQSFNPGRTRLLFDLGIGAAMLLIQALVFGTSYRKAV